MGRHFGTIGIVGQENKGSFGTIGIVGQENRVVLFYDDALALTNEPHTINSVVHQISELFILAFEPRLLS